MFHRYQYTCPDVIHVRKVAKRTQLAAIGVQLVFWGGLWAMGRRSMKQVEVPDNTELPAE